MANTLAEVTPKILAQGLLALRGATIMPQVVNSDYSSAAGMKGSTIDVPIPSAVVAQAVTAANTPPSTADSAPTSVPIALDQWYEAPFYLTDKDMQESVDGVIPMQASEAIKAIASNVNSYIHNKYPGVYGYTGTAGTTPFASTTVDASQARKILTNQLAAKGDRRFIMDTDADANALELRAFQDASFRGDRAGILEGEIGRKLGFDFYTDQEVVTHTSTVFTAGAVTANGVNAVGAATVSIAKATNAAPLVAGDIISFAGDTQTYSVVTGVTLIVGNTNVAISPALKVATTGGEVVTLRATHVVNLAFHRDAFAFASRPLSNVGATELGSVIQSAVDPVSGIVLRLEVTREHKRTRWSYDILYGAELVRPELATRVAG